MQSPGRARPGIAKDFARALDLGIGLCRVGMRAKVVAEQQMPPQLEAGLAANILCAPGIKLGSGSQCLR